MSSVSEYHQTEITFSDAKSKAKLQTGQSAEGGSMAILKCRNLKGS